MPPSDALSEAHARSGLLRGLVIWLPVGLVLDGVIVAAWWRWM